MEEELGSAPDHGRPVYLLGESFGGLVSLAVAANCPAVDRVILVNPVSVTLGLAEFELKCLFSNFALFHLAPFAWHRFVACLTRHSLLVLAGMDGTGTSCTS